MGETTPGTMGGDPALRLLILALSASLALAGCLGGPSPEDIDTDQLPSEYDTPQGPAADPDDPENPTVAPQDPQQPEVPGADPGNGSTDEEEPESPDNSSDYIGPPDPMALVRNSTGEPTDRALGTAPFHARFYLDSKIAGNAIPYWTLTLSGHGRPIAEGHKLPVEIDHTIVAPGKHTALFFVSDGSSQEQRKIEIEVQRPPPPPPVKFNGTATGFWAPGQGYVGEVETHSFELDRPVRTILANLTAKGTAFDLDFELVAPDGTSVARHVDINEPSGLVVPAQEDPIRVSDPDATHRLGEWTLLVYPALSVFGEYELEVSFT